jgi:hypothetical protein
MRPIRRITVTVILAILLIPGLLHARAPVGFWERAGVSSPDGLFEAVWNLLAFFRPNGEWSSAAKSDSDNGGALDPSGSSAPGGTATESSDTESEGDNGGGLDPSGEP